MTIIENHTGVPHFWFEQAGQNGERLDVLVVRATFDFAAGGARISRSSQQRAIVFGDSYEGPVESDPLLAVIREDGDLVPFKPGTDILVTGHASAPRGEKCANWQGGVRVGDIEKRLSFHGPREFRRTFTGWELTPARPIDSIPLDYRLAFGGRVSIPTNVKGESDIESFQYRANPAGRGWLPSPSSFTHLSREARAYCKSWLKQQLNIPAPQIECPNKPISDPFGNPGTHGLGAIPRWCEPRLSFQGKFDEKWMDTRYPLLPIDFNSRFFQSSHADLTKFPHLQGDEEIVLEGLLAEKTEMRLPGWTIIATVRRFSGERTITLPLLDTVRLSLDAREISLVWRAHFTSEDPAVEIILGVTSGKVHSSFRPILSERL